MVQATSPDPIAVNRVCGFASRAIDESVNRYDCYNLVHCECCSLLVSHCVHRRVNSVASNVSGQGNVSQATGQHAAKPAPSCDPKGDTCGSSINDDMYTDDVHLLSTYYAVALPRACMFGADATASFELLAQWNVPADRYGYARNRDLFGGLRVSLGLRYLLTVATSQMQTMHRAATKVFRNRYTEPTRTLRMNVAHVDAVDHTA